MRTEEAVAHFGGVVKLAEALGIGRAAVYQWGEHPPVDRQCQIEIVSGGVLRADVERPDDPAPDKRRKKGCAA